MSDFRDYENGVADVIASIFGEDAVVRRNVHLPGKRSGRTRQVDILVEGKIFKLTDATMIVDCKRWKKNLDVADVETFISTADDIGCDIGIIVTSSGASQTALTRARSERGIRVRALSIESLKAWRPAGTFSQTIAVPVESENQLAAYLREKGYRVAHASSADPRATESRIAIDVFRHYGTTAPTSDVQRAALDDIDSAGLSLSLRIVQLSHGICVGGGTPAHRWLTVLADTQPFVKILVASEEDIRLELANLADICGISESILTVDRPADWPPPDPFFL